MRGSEEVILAFHGAVLGRTNGTICVEMLAQCLINSKHLISFLSRPDLISETFKIDPKFVSFL